MAASEVVLKYACCLKESIADSQNSDPVQEAGFEGGIPAVNSDQLQCAVG